MLYAMTTGTEKRRKCTSQIFHFWNFVTQILVKRIERFSKKIKTKISIFKKNIALKWSKCSETWNKAIKYFSQLWPTQTILRLFGIGSDIGLINHQKNNPISYKVYRSLKVKTTPKEDDLKMFNVEYFSNHWSDLIQIINLS
jgi:hypothetical protein